MYSTHFHNARLVHGDTILRVFRQLEEGAGRGPVDVLVLRLEVPHQRRHCALLAKRDPVVAPVTAASDRFRQVPPQLVVRLEEGQGEHGNSASEVESHIPKNQLPPFPSQGGSQSLLLHILTSGLVGASKIVLVKPL